MTSSWAGKGPNVNVVEFVMSYSDYVLFFLGGLSGAVATALVLGLRKHAPVNICLYVEQLPTAEDGGEVVGPREWQASVN